jgi:hypothetical protein
MDWKRVASQLMVLFGIVKFVTLWSLEFGCLYLCLGTCDCDEFYAGNDFDTMNDYML